jgi:hypothetical protein
MHRGGTMSWGGMDYDFEDTPRFEASQRIEKQLISDEIERNLKNDPRN